MRAENEFQDTSFGYLSTVESADHGYFGGYLVVSAWGRPLEFHCTAPIRPSRAQQILYGPTLHDYLLGEQIGQTLLAAAGLRPRIVLTDQIATLGLRSACDLPLVRLAGRAEESSSASTTGDGVSTAPFDVAGYLFELPPGLAAHRPAVTEWLARLAERVDLAEPFGRIREAIQEAQRIGGRGQDSHEQAA